VAEKMKSQYLFINFDIPLTVSGTQYRGMFEKKITDALEAVSQFEKAFGKIKKPVLFIDEIHMIYGAGDAEGGTTAGNIIKPYLSGGLVTIIGATTPEEYQKTICKDAALVRRLSPIYIRELKEDVVLKILSAFCSGQLNPSLLLKIYQLSKTLPNTCNPDISIEILDRCLARQKATGEIVDDAMISSIVSYMKNPSD
jgi:ATP-dependent Clp protease ATP-binding subunit ClpC